MVLILWPDHPRYLERFERQTAGQDYRKMIEALSRQYRAPILDLKIQAKNGSIDSLFADLRHLNRRGAIVYSARLGRILSEMVALNYKVNIHLLSTLNANDIHRMHALISFYKRG